MKNQVSENPAKKRERLSMCLIIITSLLVTLYLTSNILAVKIIEIGSVTIFDAGTITFPITYMLGDVLTEIWGFKTAKKIIWLTFLCNTVFMAFTAVGLLLPSPDYMQESSNAYGVIFGYVPRIIAASLLGFLAGELCNSWVMERVKAVTGGRHLWLRTISSTAVGCLFDTVLFVMTAFAGTAPLCDLIGMIAIQYAVKLSIEVLGGTPLAYGIIAKIRKYCEE